MYEDRVHWLFYWNRNLVHNNYNFFVSKYASRIKTHFIKNVQFIFQNFVQQIWYYKYLTINFTAV